MNEGGKYFRFEDSKLSDLGNGFFGDNLVELDGFELTYITGDEGAGHGFHSHEDLDEFLVFLEGECVFNLGEEEIEVKGGSLLFIPPNVDHKVKYNTKSSVLRIKIEKDRNPS